MPTLFLDENVKVELAEALEEKRNPGSHDP